MRHVRRPRRVLRFSALLVLVALLLGEDVPARAQTEPAVRVGVSPADAFAEGMYADAAGFFKAAGLNVELVTLANSGAMGAALAGGSIDIALGNAIAIANAREQGLPFYAIAPSALFAAREPATLLMVGTASPLKTAKDLEGKTIATIELRGIQQASIRAWMVKGGADPTALRFIEMPYSSMAAALNAGRIDAAMIAEPVLASARLLTRELGSPYAAIANEWYINMWFATKDWLTKNPAAAQRFVAAIGKAAPWENTHRAQTALMLQKFLPVSDDVLTTMVRARYAEQFDPALIQPVLDTAAKYGVLKEPMKAADLIFRVSAARVQAARGHEILSIR